MIRHLVAIKWKDATTPREIEELTKLLADLPRLVPQAKHFEFGPDLLRYERSFDFGVAALFDSMDALKTYLDHPDHLVVRKKLLAMAERSILVDFEV